MPELIKVAYIPVAQYDADGYANGPSSPPGFSPSPNPAAPRSITTWVIGHEGQPHIPAAFGARKTWTAQLLADARTVLRVDGRLYEQQALRVTDDALLEELRGVLIRKYDLDPEGNFSGPETWFFRLDPRESLSTPQ